MTEAAPQREAFWKRLVGPAVLLGICLFLFGGALVDPSVVVSASNGDISEQFLGWRGYAFGEIAKGHWPLWNPYSFCGETFVGNWQTAMFYPPNYLHLVLPGGMALSAVIALHTYVGGLTMLGWLGFKGLSRVSALVGAATYMLSAPVLAHVFPGHVTWTCAAAWAPAVFHAVDGYMGTRRSFYLWAGSGALAMQVLAGYPQPVYITLVGAGLYAILNLRVENLRAVPGLAGMVALGVMIAAIQFWPGVEAGSESNRAGGTSWEYATHYAVPPENFLLALSPMALGGARSDNKSFVLAWEAWPYIGAGSLMLAAGAGVAFWRGSRRWAGTIAVTFTLASAGGAVYHLMYTYLPGAASFRVPGRWLLLASLFGAVLAAHGIEAIRGRDRKTQLMTTLLSVLAGGILLALYAMKGPIPQGQRDPGPYFGPPLLASGLFLVVFGGVAAASRVWKPGYLVLAALAVGELMVAGRSMVPTCSAMLYVPDIWGKIVDAIPKGGRIQIQDGGFRNLPLWAHVHGLSGYDPLQPRRFVEYIAAGQGKDPRVLQEVQDPLQPHPSWKLLRAGAVVDGKGRFGLLEGGLPQAFLTEDYVAPEDKSTRLAALMSERFEGRKLAILETRPAELPEVVPDGPAGTATVTSDTGEVLEIAVDAAKPTVLIVTDGYSRGWRATRTDTGAALPVLPADHMLRGVPVQPGKYTVRMEYRPTGYIIGRWVSLGAAVAWACWGVRVVLKRGRALLR